MLVGRPAAARRLTRQDTAQAGQRRREGDRRLPGTSSTSTWRCTRKLESTLPNLPPKDSTPEQIDNHQRALGKLIQQARARRKPATSSRASPRRASPPARAASSAAPTASRLKPGDHGRESRAIVKLTVNGRYPDTVPLSTMPPQVLRRCRKLPEELEYRFIGRTLILIDVHAHIIVDLHDRTRFRARRRLPMSIRRLVSPPRRVLVLFARRAGAVTVLAAAAGAASAAAAAQPAARAAQRDGLAQVRRARRLRHRRPGAVPARRADGSLHAAVSVRARDHWSATTSTAPSGRRTSRRSSRTRTSRCSMPA